MCGAGWWREEGVWLPSLTCSLKKQEAGRKRKDAKEKEPQAQVGHTKSFDSFAFSLHHLAKSQP